jgi:hypothetical protein
LSKIFLLPPLRARRAAVDSLPEHYLGFRGFPDWWQVNLRKRLPCFCRPKNFSAIAPVAAPGQCQPGLSRRGRCGDESDSAARVARVTKCIKWAQPPRCWSQPRTLTKRRTAHETSLDEGLDRRSYSSSGWRSTLRKSKAAPLHTPGRKPRQLRPPVCTENLNPDVVMMKSAEDGV